LLDLSVEFTFYVTVCYRYLVQQTYVSQNQANSRMEESMTPDLFHSHNHPERMIRKMEQYVEKRQLCDVTLVVGNKRIPAHRLVLSAASDYFAAMFMNDVKEASMEEIRMKDVDPDAMVAIVNYAYTGINLNLASIS
jgi:kelch-like protein 1/4/5